MLSIGSIVYLKDGNKKIMVLNRGAILETNTGKRLFDYSGCIYPVGLDAEQVFYFNEENIDKIVFKGYSDEEESRYRELYNNWLSENSDKFAKGNVSDLTK